MSGNLDPSQVILTPNTQQLRKWMIKAPNRDVINAIISYYMYAIISITLYKL